MFEQRNTVSIFKMYGYTPTARTSLNANRICSLETFIQNVECKLHFIILLPIHFRFNAKSNELLNWFAFWTLNNLHSFLFRHIKNCSFFPEYCLSRISIIHSIFQSEKKLIRWSRVSKSFELDQKRRNGKKSFKKTANAFKTISNIKNHYE